MQQFLYGEEIKGLDDGPCSMFLPPARGKLEPGYVTDRPGTRVMAGILEALRDAESPEEAIRQAEIIGKRIDEYLPHVDPTAGDAADRLERTRRNIDVLRDTLYTSLANERLESSE